MTLLAAAQDRKEEVCDQMSKSLKDLGDRHAEMVLSSCCHFLQSNTSVSFLSFQDGIEALNIESFWLLDFH